MRTDTQKKPTDYTGVIILVLVLPVYFSFDVFLGQEELGRSVAFVLAMVLLAIRVRWDLRKRVWFWAVILFVLLLHVPLLFLFRWPHGFHGWLPAYAMLPIALAEMLIILGAVGFVEKYIVKAPPVENV